jgi:hypothetical protein
LDHDQPYSQSIEGPSVCEDKKIDPARCSRRRRRALIDWRFLAIVRDSDCGKWDAMSAAHQFPLQIVRRVPTSFDGKDWLFEMKHDGFRMLAGVRPRVGIGPLAFWSPLLDGSYGQDGHASSVRKETVAVFAAPL